MNNAYLLSREFRDYLDSCGINGERVYKKANIPLKIKASGLYISREQYIELMNAIEESADVEAILNYSDVSKSFSFIPPIFAGLCARNGIECFNRLSEYKKLIGPFVLKVHEENKELVLTFTFDDEEKTKLPKFTQMTEDMVLLNMLRTGTGKKIIPLRVESTYEYPEKIVEYIGVKPVLANINRLYFNIEDAIEPFVTENNVMWDFLEPEFKKRIKEMEVDESFAAKVRTLLMELIPSGRGSVEAVAKEMAIAPRTLQRKLSEEKTTFIKQLNHTRELMAKNYLMNSSISTEEVAYLLGYSDMYVFMRAFRQWTGLTVKQFKMKHDVFA